MGLTTTTECGYREPAGKLDWPIREVDLVLFECVAPATHACSGIFGESLAENQHLNKLLK
jgi:hypothetical protein